MAAGQGWLNTVTSCLQQQWICTGVGRTRSGASPTAHRLRSWSSLAFVKHSLQIITSSKPDTQSYSSRDNYSQDSSDPHAFFISSTSFSGTGASDFWYSSTDFRAFAQAASA